MLDHVDRFEVLPFGFNKFSFAIPYLREAGFGFPTPPCIDSRISEDAPKEVLGVGEALLGVRDMARHEKRINGAKFVLAFLFHFQRFLVVLPSLAEPPRYQHDFRKGVVTQRYGLRVFQLVRSRKSGASKFLCWSVLA